MILFFLTIFIFNSALNAQINWFKIGSGLNYGITKNLSGNDIAIFFGGWQAKQEWVNRWSNEVYEAKLNKLGVQHLLTVKGPDELCYNKKEIELKSLADFVKNIIYATYFIDNVIIIAHSSGSFVANEFLNIMYGNDGIARDSFYVDKVHYFILDGGIGSNNCGTKIDTSAIRHIKKVYAVAAFDSTTDKYSANYQSMKILSEMFNEKSELILIDASDSGCIDKWCLHNFLITRRPHNPYNYDLEKDYQYFDSKRLVQTDYLHVLFE
jgi:hypothetical protein